MHLFFFNQCLNVEMIEDFLHLTYKPEHRYPKNRIVGGRDHFKLVQNGDNYFLGDIVSCRLFEEMIGNPLTCLRLPHFLKLVQIIDSCFFGDSKLSFA
jgi:hypothetical protein